MYSGLPHLIAQSILPFGSLVELLDAKNGKMEHTGVFKAKCIKGGLNLMNLIFGLTTWLFTNVLAVH